MRALARFVTALDVRWGCGVWGSDGRGVGRSGSSSNARRRVVAPLTAQPVRRWFRCRSRSPVVVFDQLQGPSAVYNMAIALQLVGELDVAAWGAALVDVVGRHEPAHDLHCTRGNSAADRGVPAGRLDGLGRSSTPRVGRCERLHAAGEVVPGHRF